MTKYAVYYSKTATGNLSLEYCATLARGIAFTCEKLDESFGEVKIVQFHSDFTPEGKCA